MKLLIVGGCGLQVQPAINYLLEQDEISTIIIGDINIDAALKLVEDQNNSKLLAQHIDALNHKQLVQAISEVDVVFNASGPYHLLGVKILKATIEAGKHYVDFCDDTEPTLEMLELSEQAAAKGVTAIVGLGASPGATNLISMHCAAMLDQTEEVNMYWHIGKGEPSGPAVLDHLLHIMSGDVIQFIDGERKHVPALSGLEPFKMPGIDEEMHSVFVGHPEPSTLPDYIPGVRQVVSKFTNVPDELSFFMAMQEFGLFSTEPVDVKGNKVAPRSMLIELLAKIAKEEEVAEGVDTGSCIVIDVKGQKDGKATTVRIIGRGNMPMLTSMPAALGVVLLARGEITRRGVFPPEGCIKPESIMEPLEAMGVSPEIHIL